jgi:hypothetical protein
MHGRAQNYLKNIGRKNLEGRGHRWMILKWLLRELDFNMWTGFSSFMVGSSGGLV